MVKPESKRSFVIAVICDDEQGAALIGGLMLMIALTVLGVAAITTTTLGTRIGSNYFSSAQTFYAAEAGIAIGINHLSADIVTSTQAIPVTNIGDAGYQYRSGRLSDPDPQPLVFVGMSTRAGYSIGNGTGYNPAGYVFYVYQINATGTGPRESAKELELLASYGPLAH